MLEVTCGDCGAKFKVPPKFAGSKMRCKHCSRTIVIGEEEIILSDLLPEEEESQEPVSSLDQGTDFVQEDGGQEAPSVDLDFGGESEPKKFKRHRTATDKIRSAKEMSSFEYIGFWARFVAFLIDDIAFIFIGGLVITFFQIFSIFVSPGPPWASKGDGYSDALNALFIFSLFGIPLIFVLFGFHIIEILFGIWCSATPGKIVLRLKIVDAKTGRKPRAHQFIIRSFSKIISAVPFYLGFICVAFSRRKQGWHDIIAGTAVVSTSSYNQSDLVYRRGITPGQPARPGHSQRKKQEENPISTIPSEADEIAKLAILRDEGTLTEEEFQLKKRQILGL